MGFSRTYDTGKRRALNIIWTAAERYDFEPVFMAFQQNGSPDFYMNSIIGYVHKWYHTEALSSLFDQLQHSVFSALFDGIAWLGIESSTYAKEVRKRPLLQELRKDCAEAFFAQEYGKSRQEWMAQNNLLYSLQSARWRTVLGKDPGLIHPFARRLYSELDYDASLTEEEICEKTLDILSRYFAFYPSRSPAQTVRKSSLLGQLLSLFSSKRAQYGQVLLPGASGTSSGQVSKAEGIAEESDSPADLSFIKNCFGEPMYSEAEMAQLDYVLCTGHHSNCHIYFTKGVSNSKKARTPGEEKFYDDALAQKERNLSYYRENQRIYQQAEERLSAQISHAILLGTCPFPLPEHEGALNPRKVWRAIYLEDNRVFTNTVPEPASEFSVDLLLDASASRLGVQEILAAEAYVTASSLARCHIPVQVSSFCSLKGYTVLRQFCGYGESTKRKRIFDYFAAGWNRDGLALRGAAHLMEASPCKNRILILFTDASPNDDRRIPADRKEQRPLSENYSEEAAIRDTAYEVQSLRRQKIQVMAVIHSAGKEPSGARRIYGNHFTHIEKPEQFSRSVGCLLERQIREFDET